MAGQQPEAQSSNMAQAKPTSYGKPPLRVSYKAPFSLRLRYTITSIAHFFRIMQPQQNYAESPEFLPIKNGQRVVSYRDSLSLLYLDPKSVHLARDQWKVAEIKTYKDKGTKVKHEYLVATLRDDDKGEVLLRIERRIQDSSAKAFGKAILGRSRTEPTPPSDSDSSGQDAGQPTDSKAKPFKKNAVDEIALVTPNSPNIDKQQLVQHIVFEDDKKRISLPKLIVLACAVNNYSKEYHFFEQNCYWFCYIIAELLQKLSTPSLPALATRGRQGTWLGLPAGTLWQEVDFELLQAKNDAMWNEFEDKIDSIINHPENARFKEEARLRQEEKKRAEEEKKRAEEEKKRAEEAERRMQEEARLRQEEKKEAERRMAEADKHRLEEKKEMERRIAELEAKLSQAKTT
ncbi:hypothetical protein AX14_001777 [Amanita brunnescens Koide BX004]|nr:hypothetical protein AX14_001777 [Amanita brunnescens Koide BX004]